MKIRFGRTDDVRFLPLVCGLQEKTGSSFLRELDRLSFFCLPSFQYQAQLISDFLCRQQGSLKLPSGERETWLILQPTENP
ncbi:hypothetical protein D5086_006606 [Populus alba]|uniref:Uncharacterized protein n=2 Tax=Populus TaxID=3689 RepID=A0ACC4CL12_POPAL|nr:hypothetical protein NC653_008636 [Populus alba x Populus x berolinensis]